MSIVPIVMSLVGYFVVRELQIDTVFQLITDIIIFVLLYMLLFWKYSMNNSERELLLNLINRVVKKR